MKLGSLKEGGRDGTLIVVSRDLKRGEAYLERLKREIDMVAPLFEADREVIQLHLGGGTPNFLVPAQLQAL